MTAKAFEPTELSADARTWACPPRLTALTENNPMPQNTCDPADPLPAMLRCSAELVTAASRLVPGGGVYDALTAQDDQLCRQILHTRARSFAGLTARLRYLLQILDDAGESDFAVNLAEAAIEDAEILAAQGCHDRSGPARPTTLQNSASPGQS